MRLLTLALLSTPLFSTLADEPTTPNPGLRHYYEVPPAKVENP